MERESKRERNKKNIQIGIEIKKERGRNIQIGEEKEKKRKRTTERVRENKEI